MSCIFCCLALLNTKTWTSLRLRFRGIAKHLTCYIRVKAHAIGVSIRAFTLACFFNLANFGNKNLSGRFCLYVNLVYFINGLRV